MKRILGLSFSGLFVVAFGLLMAGILRPSGTTAASEPTPPIVDGQPAQDTSTAAPDQPDSPASGPTLYRTFGSYEFRPGDSNLTFAPFGSAIYAVNIPGSSSAFKAPLVLPNASQVTRVSFYIVDNNPTYNMTLQFYRTQPSANTSQYEIGYITTAGLPTSSAVQTVTIYGAPTLTLIDNNLYAYSLRYTPVVAGNSHMLVGARVEYSVPTLWLSVLQK